MIGSSLGAPMITSFVAVERSIFSGLSVLFSVGMGRPMPGHARAATVMMGFEDCAILKGAEDSERIAEFYEYIQDGGAKEAFALLVGTFTCLKSLSCKTAKQGKVRSVAISQGDAWCFSIMPSRKKLLFHWRPPVVERYRTQIEAMKALFPETFTDKSHKDVEHWAISIESIEEALRLLLVLDLN